MGNAGPDTVDRLERSGKDGCLCPVKGGGDQNLPFCLAFLAGYLDVNTSDTSCSLEIPQIQIFAE